MKRLFLTLLFLSPALTLRAADAPEKGGAVDSQSKILRGNAVVDFLDYRLAVRDLIYKKWDAYFEKYGASLKKGRAAYEIYVSSSGVLTITEQTVGKPGGPIGALGERSILESRGGIPPYPESIKVQYPRGFFDEIAFEVQ